MTGPLLGLLASLAAAPSGGDRPGRRGAEAAARTVAILPEAEAVVALERAAPLAVVGAVADVPPGARLCYLGPGVAWDAPSPGVVVVAADAAAVPDGPDRLIVRPRGRPGQIALVGGPAPDAVAALEAIRADAVRTPSGAVGEETGRLLHVLARLRRSRWILEIGAGPGASAVWLAASLPPDGRLVAVERDSAAHTRARRSLTAAGLAASVDLHRGTGQRWLPRLHRPFDLVWLDEDVRDRGGHLASVLPLLAPRALVAWRADRRDADELARFHALARSLPGLRESATVALAEGGVALALAAG